MSSSKRLRPPKVRTDFYKAPKNDRRSIAKGTAAVAAYHESLDADRANARRQKRATARIRFNRIAAKLKAKQEEAK